MKKSLIWRIALTLIVLAIAAIYLAPTFLPRLEQSPVPQADTSEAKKESSGFRAFLPNNRISLGLDLQGGIDLTLGVEADKALENIMGTTGQSLATASRQKGILITAPRLRDDLKLEFMLIKPSDKAAFESFMATEFSQLQYASPTETGGRLRYQAEFTTAARDYYIEDTLDKALESIRERIDQFGVAEPDIRKQSSGQRLILQLPGMQDTSRALDIIKRTAHLEFRLVRNDVNPKGFMPPGVEALPLQRDPEVLLAVEKKAALTGDSVADAIARPDESDAFNLSGKKTYYVGLSFDSAGARTFAEVTGKNVDRNLAIVIDGKIHSAPRINGRIDGNASISGDFSAEEAADLALLLRSGRLPAPVTVLEERTVGPSLGKEAIELGVQAALIGGAVVVIFMLVYYGLSGLIADVMLGLNVVLILAGMAAFGATLTLPGIAGIVLTLGMAVDANVLIFERIREELKTGLTPAAAVNEGFSRATVAILDSNLTTIIAGLILYQLGTGPIRGFAVTLTLGILASMFTAVFVSRIIFDLVMSKPGRKLSIGFSLIPSTLNFSFVKIRKAAYAVSIGILVITFGYIFSQGGLKYGIDFAGGATVHIAFEEPVADDSLKTTLAGANLPGLVIQRLGENDTEYLLRVSVTEETSTGVRGSIEKALLESLPGVKYSIPSLEMVGAKVGADLRSQAVEAMFYATLLIAVYVAGRFEQRWFTALGMAIALGGVMVGFNQLVGVSMMYLIPAAVVLTVVICWRLKLIFALGAIISILHDVLITMGIFALLGKEFDLTIIAALLTTVGYSLNDTIIVYDRIRENMRRDQTTPLSEIINASINQTLSRTLLTSGTTIFVVASLLLRGGGAIHDFALVMFIGVIVGTLSSIFVASPVLIAFESSIDRNMMNIKKKTVKRDADGRIAAQV